MSEVRHDIAIWYEICSRRGLFYEIEPAIVNRVKQLLDSN
jgi:hypothetical protein